MSHKIFVNLPVKDLAKSMAFWRGLGLDFNPMFTDETAACMVFSEEGYAMLLTHDKWRQFSKKEICDTGSSSEVINCLSTDSREDVDRMADAAISGGGAEAAPAMDHGFMYQRSFFDLDGHHWEVLYMDISQFPGAQQ